MSALPTVGGLLAAVAFIVWTVFRVVDRREPIGPTWQESSAARIASALGLPIFGFFAVLLVAGLLV